MQNKDIEHQSCEECDGCDGECGQDVSSKAPMNAETERFINAMLAQVEAEVTGKKYEMPEPVLPAIRNERGEKLGRNDKCLCGSGRKFKRCCLPKL